MLKKKRLEEVLKRMSRMGIDQMIITDPISILYLTEVWIDACERLVALYINKNGKNYLFVNNMFSVPEKMGVPVIWKESEFEKKLKLWVETDRTVEVYFPDETSEIISSIFNR